MEPQEPQVMEYDAATGEYTFRNFTPEEQADNDERASQIETP